jgi:hypothetical protein
LPCLGICGRHPPLEIAAFAKQGSEHHWKFSKMHAAFNIPYVYDYLLKLCRQQAEVIQIMRMHMFLNTGQGET